MSKFIVTAACLLMFISPVAGKKRFLNQNSTGLMSAKNQSISNSSNIIVTLKSGISSKESVVASISTLANVKSVDSLSALAGIYRVMVINAEFSEKVVSVLKRNSAIQFVEYDQRVSIDFTPNDEFYEDLWGMKKIKAPNAWDSSTGSRSVVVCVIDTGVDYTHDDLIDNMWRNPGEIGLDGRGLDKATNGVDDDGNGVIDDVYGYNAVDGSGDPWDDNSHGTHCAGTIGAVGHNGIGVVGVNHQVSIMACKFLDSDGGGFTSGAIECLDYALRMGATITSNSWGGGGFSSGLSALIDLAQSKGQLFVAAAGNDAQDNDFIPHYPASYSQDIVISVASTTSDDELSWFSCFGRTSVDLGAPGSNILSTIPFDESDGSADGSSDGGFGGYYAAYSGTSMATPHVSGALALMYAVKPDLSATDAKKIVMSSGETLGSLINTVSGKRLDLAAAIEALMKMELVQPTQVLSSTTFDLVDSYLRFTPDSRGNFTTICTKTKYTNFPVNPEPIFEKISFSKDDDSIMISLGFDFPFMGVKYKTAFVSSNGFVSFGISDFSYIPSLDAHFSMPRISVFFADLVADSESKVSWKISGGSAVITWERMMQYMFDDSRVSMQLSLSPNGTVSMTYKNIVKLQKTAVIVGISRGQRPTSFVNVDFSAARTCSSVPPPFTPEQCFVCKDDPKYLKGGVKGRNCAFVAKLPPSTRCNVAADVIGCPVTCGACKLL